MSSTIFVNITRGFHRNKQISGIFEMVNPFKMGAQGGQITVKAPPDAAWALVPFPRIKLSEGDFTLVDASGDVVPMSMVTATQAQRQSGSSEEPTFVPGTAKTSEQLFAENETDEDAMKRMYKTFAMLDRITDSAAQGIIRGIIVSGPPGIGKSFGVEKQLDAANMVRTLAGQDPLYEIVSGGVSGIGMYQKLYHARNAGHVIVFDDCDQILYEEETLNLLKAALNSGDRRRISWHKESKVLLGEDIPNTFDFNGSIMFLTNVNFHKSIERRSRIGAHLEALLSRCHYLDLAMSGDRDKLLRIKQCVRDGMLEKYDFTPKQEAEIIDFIVENSKSMLELSLRAVKKIADFVKSDPTDWIEPVEATILKRGSYYDRLLKKQQEYQKNGLVLNDQ